MSYNSKKIEFSREHINVIELDLDYCSLTFGVPPCTASGSGDSKCYNTLASTQDKPNYTPITKTYRFCEPRSPIPIGLDAIPSLTSVNIAAAEIDLSGGVGVRASVDCSFRDHPSSDIDIDKYVNERTYIALERGSFWTKFRARNPNYQFKAMRVLSGYLNDDGSYDAANFQVRHYVIDKINVSGGTASVTGKDPLKLAGSKKAQAPMASKGQLQSAIVNNAINATLIPAGVGNSEYPTSGKVLIKSEVISFTRSGDNLTLTRGQNNTVATSHSANDTVQLCLDYNGKTLDFIVNDLLTNYANFNPLFIPTSAWNTEVSTYLSGLLTGIIVKPHDVNKLLKELSESMPHYLWWDERTQELQLTALKAPPLTADILDMDENLIADSVRVTDDITKRVSTVFVNFGQFDPTKKLDEPNNYEQTYARIDTDSISKYGSNEIKTINSRWITSLNKAAALQLAALIGRRFSNIPRFIDFSLDAKDSDVWAGQSRMINHRDITDFSGLPVDTIFQILSVKESGDFKYKGLEFAFGDSLPEDEGGGDPTVDLIILGSDLTNINLRTVYDSLFPTPDASTKAKIVIDTGVKIGSTSVLTHSIDTGSWPVGATVILQINPTAFAVGKGGDGESAQWMVAEDGGTAIILNHNLELVNNGVVGGGGGSGARDRSSGSGASGGAGAGHVASSGYSNLIDPADVDELILDVSSLDGTVDSGGLGGILFFLFANFEGGKGGDLGQAGDSRTSPGGAAGIAIDKNGYTLTQTIAGDIRGAIIV